MPINPARIATEDPREHLQTALANIGAHRAAMETVAAQIAAEKAVPAEAAQASVTP